MYYLRLKFDNDESIDIYPYEDELSQRWFNEVRKNINNICKEDEVKLHRMTVNKFLNMNNKKFDIIFADPPYEGFDFFETKESISNILSLNGLFCMETKKTKLLECDDNIRVKYYGNTQVIFWQIN